MLFLLFLIQWFTSTSAQLCASSREFPVDNCTACPKEDLTRGNIQMAQCNERKDGFTCECVDFPSTAMAPSLLYYPYADDKENVTRCSTSWVQAPVGFTALTIVTACVLLYAIMHCFYIVARSVNCLNKRCGCTKGSAAALLFGMCSLSQLIKTLWTLVAQGEITLGKIGASNYVWLAHSSDILIFCGAVTSDVGQVLLYTSICDMVYHGQEMARKRRCINISFWILAGTTTLMFGFFTFVPLTGVKIWTSKGMSRTMPMAGKVVQFMYSTLFVFKAHWKMNEVVKKQSGMSLTSPLICKMEELCRAICRYYYAGQAQFVVCFFLLTANNLCLGDLSASSFWILKQQWFAFGVGVTSICFTCLIEGKGVPTFPMCLCRRQKKEFNISKQLSGLGFSSKLGEAVSLLDKHGLDHKRRKEFPVEAAMESLLSTSTLKVAAAQDMDLNHSVNYFLERCTDDQGKIASRFFDVPVGRMLRPGLNQYVVGTNDISHLRDKTKQCLDWAEDPERAPIHNTSIDEAAAIQLYTQETCVYPMLNSALRDHPNQDKLAPFLPYLKLLLTGLNKLPLVRAKVYRGVKGDLHEEYNKLNGRMFTWWALSSTSLNQSLAGTYLGNHDSTLFHIDAVGVDIAAFSNFPDEKEVLMLPGTCLVSKPGVKVKSNRWMFEVSIHQFVKDQLLEDPQSQLYKNEDGEQENPPIIPTDEENVAEVEIDGTKAGGEGQPVSISIDVEDFNQRFQNLDLPHPGWEDVLYSPYA